MPDELKIPIRTPGADQAKRDLKEIAAGEKAVGQAAGEAGKKTSAAAGETQQALDKTHRKAAQGKTSFSEWGKAGIAATVAITAAVMKLLGRIQAVNDRLRATYSEFVGLTQQSETIALAQIRGKSERATVNWMLGTGQRYGLKPEEVRGAAFGIESGLKPEQVGGEGALGEIETAAFKTMRAGGASGKTAAGLAIAAYESGMAKTPAGFRSFYAKATTYAGESRMNLQDLGSILSRLLPMAVKAGIDPDYFMSMASAMSYRIEDPSRLATALEQIIRAAGKKSKALEAFAKRGGRTTADLSARDVMEFQSGFISKALQTGGPQGAEAAAETLGLSSELAGVYGAAFDATVQARMGMLQGKGQAAQWGPVVGRRYAQVSATPEARFTSGQQRERFEQMKRSIKDALYHAALVEAAADIAEYLKAPQGGMAGFAQKSREVLLSRDQMARERLLYNVTNRLKQVSRFDADPARKAQAASLMGDLTGWSGTYIMTGVGERDDIQRALEFLDEGGREPMQGVRIQGGTHYHNHDKRDPAGRPVEPAASR